MAKGINHHYYIQWSTKEGIYTQVFRTKRAATKKAEDLLNIKVQLVTMPTALKDYDWVLSSHGIQGGNL